MPYVPLEQCGRHGFAWEWLRRSPGYQAAASLPGRDIERSSAAAKFGLHRLEPIDRAVADARPIWREEADRHVLVATAQSANGEDDVLDIGLFGPLATCHIGPAGHEHWLFSDGCRHIRLDIIDGTLGDGPVRLDYHLVGLDHALPRLATLHRLIALARTRHLLPALFPAERRARRWALVLRVHDALTAGASQRDIAERLFDLGPLVRWRVTAPSYRRRVQRLVAAARTAATVDPRH